MTTPTPTLTPDDLLRLVTEQPVLIAGAGVAGQGMIDLFRRIGAELLIADDRADCADLSVAEATELLGPPRYLEATGDRHATAPVQERFPRPGVVITSPGWRPDSPLLRTARAQRIPVLGDIEAAWLVDHSGATGSPHRWVAITGTNGKTTTTSMTEAIFSADAARSGLPAAAVGNVGTSPGHLIGAEEPSSADSAGADAASATDATHAGVFIAEVSSFQLHWAPSFTPDVGCVLNIADDHLDWHGSVADYAAAKARALRTPIAVLCIDEDPVLRAALPVLRDSAAAGTLRELWLSTIGTPASALDRWRDLLADADPASALADTPIRGVVGIDGDRLCLLTPEASTTTDLGSALTLSPAGPAGQADAAAAAAIAASCAVPASAIALALDQFEVHAHRGQVVAEGHGIRWIDNSKATNPHAAQAALAGEEGVIWVAGGQLKGARVDGLIRAIGSGLRAAVVLGADRKDIEAELGRQLPELTVVTIDTTHPQRAMEEAVRIAAGLARPGDQVVLAPAAASLDMYSGMGQRGDLFADYARAAAERPRPTTPTQEA